MDAKTKEYWDQERARDMAALDKDISSIRHVQVPLWCDTEPAKEPKLRDWRLGYFALKQRAEQRWNAFLYGVFVMVAGLLVWGLVQVIERYL